jgi:hypothetical protein
MSRLRPIDPTPYHFPSLAQKLRDTERRASDLDWDGNAAAAANSRRLADHYRTLIAKGETHDPPF